MSNAVARSAAANRRPRGGVHVGRIVRPPSRTGRNHRRPARRERAGLRASLQGSCGLVLVRAGLRAGAGAGDAVGGGRHDEVDDRPPAVVHEVDPHQITFLQVREHRRGRRAELGAVTENDQAQRAVQKPDRTDVLSAVAGTGSVGPGGASDEGESQGHSERQHPLPVHTFDPPFAGRRRRAQPVDVTAHESGVRAHDGPRR